MRRALYVLLSTLLFLVLSPLLLLARKTRRGRLERFGLYRPDVLPEGGWPRVWLHGASAGDLQALAPMIGRFRERFPDARIFLTTMTDTGRAMAEQRLRAQVDGVLYAPWDLPGATRRAMRALRPDLLVLEYAEIGRTSSTLPAPPERGWCSPTAASRPNAFAGTGPSSRSSGIH